LYNVIIGGDYMESRDKVLLCIDILKNEYPDAKCSLIYNTPIEMLIATRLSAQCTDLRVNAVTPALFERFKNVYDFANADIHEIEEYICPCGLYKTKAKDIIEMCRKIISDFNGQVPDTMDGLTSLSGVGRKTANLVLGDIYGKPAIVVDTHFIRVTRRLGFHTSKDPLKIEEIMKDIIPEAESNLFCHRVVLFGRAVCVARAPKCSQCKLRSICKYFKMLGSDIIQ
jgi:endonuclease III